MSDQTSTANKTTGGVPDRFREDFIKIYGAAVATYTSVDVLQAAHRHTARGHRQLLARFIGDRVILSGSGPLSGQHEMWLQYVHGTLVLKPLCVELLLKAIAYSDDLSLEANHNLVAQYDRLTETTRIEIEAGLSGAYGEAAEACGISEGEEYKFRSGSVRDILDRHNGDFQQIRYGELPIQDILKRLEDLQLNITAVLYALLTICIDRAMAAGISDFNLSNPERL